MSWYSLSVLQIIRSVDSFIKNQFDKLNQKIDKNQFDLSNKISEVSTDIQTIRMDLHDVINNQLGQKNQLDEILALLQHSTKLLSVSYTFEDNKTINSQGGLLMVITDVQSVTARVVEKDAKGNPVKFDPATIKWSSADESKVSVTQNPDGSATFTAVGPLTAAEDGTDAGVQVSVTDGNLTQVDFIQVTNSAATTLGITFDQPV